MSLKQDLERFRQEFNAKQPTEILELMEKADAELAEQHLLRKAPKTGDMASDFSLAEATGRPVPAIRDAGGLLIAVSPQSPDNSLSTQEKNALTFPVLSDVAGQAAKSFGVLFELPSYLQKLYTKFGHNLDVVNADGRWTLPFRSPT
jgi:hypothetical protein